MKFNTKKQFQYIDKSNMLSPYTHVGDASFTHWHYSVTPHSCYGTFRIVSATLYYSLPVHWIHDYFQTLFWSYINTHVHHCCTATILNRMCWKCWFEGNDEHQCNLKTLDFDEDLFSEAGAMYNVSESVITQTLFPTVSWGNYYRL